MKIDDAKNHILPQDLIDILDRFKEDDPSAFERIYLEYNQKVYRFAKRYTNNKEDAEEIVQDVFVKLWDVRRTIDTACNFDNFLFAVTRNLLFDRHRRKVNEQHFQTTVLASLEEEFESTEDEIIAQDLSLYIEKIVEQLPPKQQEVFNLSRKQMLNREEIAEKLGIAEETVKAHIHQALSKIRKILANEGIIFIFFYFLTNP